MKLVFLWGKVVFKLQEFVAFVFCLYCSVLWPVVQNLLAYLLVMSLPRPFLTLHVFGSKGVGKTTLKTQWFDSSQSRAISEVADVHIRIQVRVALALYLFPYIHSLMADISYRSVWIWAFVGRCVFSL